MEYIVGSGWFCGGWGYRYAHLRYDTFARTPEFFTLWHTLVDRYLAPEKILIVDAASPEPVPPCADKRLEVVRAVKNLGPFLDTKKYFCGATNAILTAASYALYNEADYFVYLEQDALISGQGIIEEAVRNMKKNRISFGEKRNSPDNPYPTEQSLIIVSQEFLPEFLFRVTSLCRKYSDKQMVPELKFYHLFKDDVDYLPFGYGRDRPINWNERYLYVQHFAGDELDCLLRREKLSRPVPDKREKTVYV